MKPKHSITNAFIDIKLLRDRIRKVNVWWYKRENKKPKTVEIRNMKEYDSALFLQDLQQIDWKTILDPLSDDPSSMTEHI